ncbi:MULTISPECIES: DUF4340 domain-containing protein [unclassified Paenibacillus]|uniref:DUF4340 domain-containing protein n=1 Tax=unclassified Paenibacillus TaxID=185978 RepID=UPI001AE3FC38|nr:MULTISPECIES: DUF4340 domain-containing protein [unclassified Paenibacillus]MBP1157742.1 hypothetical protein [Paenibacillus sp. PvP091]MBP1171522.1 hypothetical protein [Paenibacillus sp. PvR098]MBP2442550.1 hypothetical protein [Paenibacillus sp. PvP052]
MKRLIPTMILVILCIGGFWFASSKDFFQEKLPEAPALVTVNKQEVVGYTINKGDAVIELQQKDGLWTMTKPSAVPLNEAQQMGWIDAFNAVRKDKTVDENPSDLAQFGLNLPAQEFSMKLADGTTHSLFVGGPVAVQGFYYAKFSGSPEVFQISESHLTALAKQQMDFMEKSPIQMDYEQVRALSVDWKGRKWTLTKSEPDKPSYEASWKLGDQEVKGVDASGYLDKAALLSTEQLAKPAAEVKGLDQPELRIEIQTAGSDGKETTTAYTGKVEGDNVWISKQGGEWAFAIPAAAIQELADKDKESPAEQK